MGRITRPASLHYYGGQHQKRLKRIGSRIGYDGSKQRETGLECSEDPRRVVNPERDRKSTYVEQTKS